MSIVAIISSPRKGANSEAIVKAIAEGAKGKDVKMFYLNGLTNAKGCQACMACKKSVGCVVKDDNGEILKAIRDAEGVIISSPCYFGEVTGQFKLLQDRFYSFVGPDFTSNIAPGKKLATVITHGGGVDEAKALADKLEGIMTGFLKCEAVGKIVSPDCNEDTLEKAKAIGAKF
jgi:Multimeric flavodoxin WrbA